MTLEEILLLPDHELNMLIEQHCTTHQWEHVLTDSPGRGTWQLDHPDVPGRLWSTVPHLHYTASWEKAMELRQRLGQYIDLVWSGNVQIVRSLYGAMPALVCTTPEEVRLALCQLILWQTCAQQAWSTEEAKRQQQATAEESRLAHGDSDATA